MCCLDIHPVHFPSGNFRLFPIHCPSLKTVMAEARGELKWGEGRERGLQKEDGEGRLQTDRLGAHDLDLVMTHTSADLTSRPGEGSNMLVFKLCLLPFTEAVLYELAQN